MGKSELALAGAGQGLPQLKTQASQDICPVPLTYVDTGVFDGGSNDYYEVHTSQDFVHGFRYEVPPNPALES